MKTFLTIFFLFLSTSVFADSCVSGDCVNGYGTYVWDDGEKYIGESKDNVSHGQGIHTYANGDKYAGEWKRALKEGQGTYIFGPGEWDGDKHVGEYKNDLKEGQGTYIYGPGEWDGDKYVGEFKNDLREGKGIYYYANGDKYIGEWKNDLEVGQGTLEKNITTDEKRIAKIAEIAEEKRRAEIVEKEKRIAEEKRRAENVKKLLCQENGGKYFSELKSLSGKTFIDACADIFIENWLDYFGWGLSTITKRDLNLKKGKIIYLDLGVDKINSKNDSDYINGGKLEVYNWFQFFGNNAYEARVICSMNDEDADQYVDNGMTKLKGAELFGIFGGYSAGYDGGLIIKECHIVGDDGMSF